MKHESRARGKEIKKTITHRAAERESEHKKTKAALNEVKKKVPLHQKIEEYDERKRDSALATRKMYLE